VLEALIKADEEFVAVKGLQLRVAALCVFVVVFMIVAVYG
jgi:hypothetical protein